MAVELFFHFNCHGFKPVAIEMKKSGNVQHDPEFFTEGHAQMEDSSIQAAVFKLQSSNLQSSNLQKHNYYSAITPNSSNNSKY
jgi:hypothetical protein